MKRKQGKLLFVLLVVAMVASVLTACVNGSTDNKETKWGDWTVTKAPTCTEKGEEQRTDQNDSTNTETREIDALGHDYEVTEWVWAEGYSSATATFTCKRDASHQETVNATVSQKNYAATEEEDGKTVYTATVTLGGKTYTDTKEIGNGDGFDGEWDNE